MKKLVTFSLLLLFATSITFGQRIQFVFSTTNVTVQNKRVSGGTEGLFSHQIGFSGISENNGLGKYIANAEFAIKDLIIPPNSVISIDLNWGFQVAPGVTFTLSALYQGKEVSSKMIFATGMPSNWITLSLDQLSSPVDEVRIILSASQANQSFFALVTFGVDNLRYTLSGQSSVLVYSFEDEVVTGIENGIAIPKGFELLQNYPNPFNPSTNISFNVPTAGRYSLRIYDVLGKEVTTLINEELSAGIHKVRFNASNLATGTYIYSLRGNGVSLAKKMILMK